MPGDGRGLAIARQIPHVEHDGLDARRDRAARARDRCNPKPTRPHLPRAVSRQMPRLLRAATPAASFAFAAALTSALIGALRTPPAAAATITPPLHAFESVALSPDGRYVASLESDEAAIEGTPTQTHLVIRRTSGGAPRTVALPCAPSPDCVPSDLVWYPHAEHVAFVLRSPKATTRSLFEVDATGGKPHEILRFDGLLNAPRFSPAGALAVLATAGAHKEIGATQAGAPIVGVQCPDNLRVPSVGSSREGESGPKIRPKGVVDGRQANIPVLIFDRYQGTKKSRGIRQILFGGRVRGVKGLEKKLCRNRGVPFSSNFLEKLALSYGRK